MRLQQQAQKWFRLNVLFKSSEIISKIFGNGVNILSWGLTEEEASMNKKISGFGMVRSGVYENVVVEGCGFASGDICVNHIKVAGAFKGKSIWNTLDICVEGVSQIEATDFADKLIIKGAAKIDRPNENFIRFLGTGAITAQAFECNHFHLTGKCHIHKLKADEIHILEDNNHKSKKAQQSVAEQIYCKKLIAYHLKAKKIVAQEVQLHGICEIDTLICEKAELCDPECKVKDYISK